jgi:hypothetical protein
MADDLIRLAKTSPSLPDDQARNQMHAAARDFPL